MSRRKFSRRPGINENKNENENEKKKKSKCPPEPDGQVKYQM